MQKYVALLRGINVGGNNRVEMPKLKLAFEGLGYKNVKTYINSGNVIFESDLDLGKDDLGKNGLGQIVAGIEASLKKRFGFEIKVFVCKFETLQKICKEIPKDWQNDDSQKTDILFLWEGYNNKETIKLIKTNPEVDSLLFSNGAIIWNIKRADYAKSGMKKFIGTEVYKNMTARNVNTVRKLGE